MSEALAGALRRCPPLAVLALRRAGRLASHPARTTSISQFIPRGYLADPIDAIKFSMEQKGLTAKDLTPMIGRLNRAYEILNRKRALTLPMIWRLHEGLGIPAEAQIKPAGGQAA